MLLLFLVLFFKSVFLLPNSLALSVVDFGCYCLCIPSQERMGRRGTSKKKLLLFKVAPVKITDIFKANSGVEAEEKILLAEFKQNQ